MELRVLNIDANSTEVIYAGVSATLEFNLNNDLDELKSFKAGDQIQFNLPSSFITLEDASLSLNSANWKAIEINPTKSYFFIECTQPYDWNSSNPIVFQMIGVKNKSDKQPPQNGDVTTKSQPIFFGSGPTQQLSLNNPPVVGRIDLSTVLDVSLEDNGEIYVGNNLSNNLILNFKNINSKAIFNGTEWPDGLGPMVSVFFDIVEDKNSSIGALTNTTNGFKIKAEQIDSQLAWKTNNPENETELTWELTPNITKIIGTGTEANVSFEFSDIIPLTEGHTQMYVQFTGFPSDDTKLYNDHTFVLDIDKKPTAKVEFEVTPIYSDPNPQIRIQLDPNKDISIVNLRVNNSDGVPLKSSILDTNNNRIGLLEIDYETLRTKAEERGYVLPTLSAYENNKFELHAEFTHGGMQNIPIETPAIPIKIGDLYAGGIVFWIDPANNNKGLVCALEDQSTGIRWCNGSYTDTGALGEKIGAGSSNTDAIISKQGSKETSYAAGLAKAYVNSDKGTGVFDDWFLPSKDELYKMWENKDAINAALKITGGTSLDSYCWSSTENGSKYAWRQNFLYGNQLTSVKDATFNVRVVRAF